MICCGVETCERRPLTSRRVSVHGAQASAALDGADIAVADDSPMGRVLSAAQALTGEVPGQVETWSRALCKYSRTCTPSRLVIMRLRRTRTTANGF